MALEEVRKRELLTDVLDAQDRAEAVMRSLIRLGAGGLLLPREVHRKLVEDAEDAYQRLFAVRVALERSGS